MLKLTKDGALQECGVPESPGAVSYPVYHREFGGGLLAANSFTDEVWLAREDEVRSFGRDALLERFARGPGRAELAEKAAREAASAREGMPYHLAFCPTYSCNLRCVYCYQQGDKTLDKGVISGENLAAFFAHADALAAKVRAGQSGRPVVLQLFGGEPFTPATKPVIKKVFEFCREKKIHITATTNGVALDGFMDLLLPYHGYVSGLGISIDGVGAFHDSRRKSVAGQGTFDKIVRNVNLLLRAGIRVALSMTLDKSNIGQLEPYFEFAAAQGWTDNPLVEFSMARVDDRKFETGYGSVMLEGELLAELLAYNARRPLPANTKFSFINSGLELAKRLKISFNQKGENRGRFHYCWASSELDDIVYVDPALDVYRCTYTVGDKKKKIGSLGAGFSLDGWRAHGTWSRAACAGCSIGGYCCGGCKLSSEKDFERNCREEKANFEYLMERVVVPKLSAMLALQKK